MLNWPPDLIPQLPKVVLHDHLDGGLRPQTILDLAEGAEVELPETDPDRLKSWFEKGASGGSLSRYLEGFRYTTAVMQTQEALERVAREALEDLAADGVVYAEVRFAPCLHMEKGLPLEKVMDAVLESLRTTGERLSIHWGLVVCALRGSEPHLSLEMAELAVQFRDRGCVGFDLAGDEFGHPPKNHLEAFQFCKRQNFNITIHAGEAFGPASIWQALQFCGAHRIGHGTRLIEDMAIEDGRLIRMGSLAQYVLDHRIPIEICLRSNLQTGAVSDLKKHPFKILKDHNFRVTLNADNRLMSNTSASGELALARELYDLSLEDLEKLVINGMKSAFLPHQERCDLIFGAIKPGFAKVREELGLPKVTYPGRGPDS